MLAVRLTHPGLTLLAIVFALTIMTRGTGALCQTRSASAPRSPGAHASPRPAPGSQLIAEGVAAFERGDAATARELLARALAADPRNPETHTYLGAIADRAGDLVTAEHHFAAAARLAPQSASARNNHGAVLLRLNRAREAAAEFEASLRLDAQQANALVNLARLRFDANTPEGLRSAAELFLRADALAPDAEIARALTVIALRRHESARAASYYRAYIARLAGASDNTASAASAAARAELGGALFEAGLFFEAQAELTAALALNPNDVDAVVRLARVYLARKDIAAAGRTLEAAVARKLEAASVYALLADVYEKSGHVEHAIPTMRRSLQLEPSSEKYRFQYGLLLTKADAPAAAVIRLDEALRTFPDSPRLWLALGYAQLKLEKNAEAAQAFRRAAELDPKLAQAYAYLGVTSVALGQYDEGVKFFEQALQRDPKLAIVHFLIADALLKQTNADAPRIEANLQQAIKLDATYAPSRLALGKLYARSERFAEAAAELERVVALDPNLAEAYYQLGRAYSRLKRTAEAQTTLATFKRLGDAQKQQEQEQQRDIVRRLADVRY